jgi:hypothetical protein
MGLKPASGLLLLENIISSNDIFLGYLLTLYQMHGLCSSERQNGCESWTGKNTKENNDSKHLCELRKNHKNLSSIWDKTWTQAFMNVKQEHWLVDHSVYQCLV